MRPVLLIYVYYNCKSDFEEGQAPVSDVKQTEHNRNDPANWLWAARKNSN